MANFKNYHYVDTYYDFHVSKTMRGFRENVLIFNDSKGSLPWYASKCVYTFFTLICLSWIPRILFVNNSTRVTFDIQKIILN